MNWAFYERELQTEADRAAVLCACCKEPGHVFEHCPVFLNDQVRRLDAEVFVVKERFDKFSKYTRWDRAISALLWFVLGAVVMYLGMVIRA